MYIYIYIYFKLKQVDLKTVQFFVFKIEDYSSIYIYKTEASEALTIFHVITILFFSLFILFISDSFST